mmetsp:Transcript_8844/g.10585  ORF Transcript_8844/g.10585 Transcript_8844/m.10585 type:complete len:105 (-) Transcript_8844:704-1018(-)
MYKIGVSNAILAVSIAAKKHSALSTVVLTAAYVLWLQQLSVPQGETKILLEESAFVCHLCVNPNLQRFHQIGKTHGVQARRQVDAKKQDKGEQEHHLHLSVFLD